MPRRLWLGKLPPPGFFAAPGGSATGDGSVGDPWDLQTALNGGPSSEVQPGDTVWLRGGTYTGSFTCALDGSVGNYITFRAYPGERATIDQDRASGTTPQVNVIDTTGSSYVIVRDLESINSNTDRFRNPDVTGGRGDSVWVTSPHSKVINCFLHDAGEAVGAWDSAPDAEIYGNLIQHQGDFRAQGDKTMGVAIDIYPAGGSAVVPVAEAESAATSTSSPLTFSHNNTGDYLVVFAFTHTGAYTDLSVTYNGVSMTRIQGATASYGACALFGLANPAAGSHNVVVTCGVSTDRLRAEAKSFNNAHQTTVPDAEGSWIEDTTSLPPHGLTATSAANHLVVDGFYSYNAYTPDQDYAPSGANSIIGVVHFTSGSANPAIGMSSAAGAASVSMAWDWTPGVDGHGHGMYVQSGVMTGDAVSVVGDHTVTSASNPWLASCVGANIMLRGAGPGGAWLDTTITSRTSAGSIEVADAPSTAVTSDAVWYKGGKTIKDNIVYGGCGDNTIQMYGTSGPSAVHGDVSRNALIFRGTVIGGLGGFRVRGTSFHDNYTWENGLDIGYHSSNLEGLSILDNYLHDQAGVPAYAPPEQVTATGNTVIGANSAFQAQYPTNTFFISPTVPTTNVVFVNPNTYEANRANIIVYNWEDLDNVSVDLSSAVAVGTPIRIVNAQDYFNAAAVVYEGVYAGGTVSLPMGGLTCAAPLDYAVNQATWDNPLFGFSGVMQPTGRGFNCFIVRAQAAEVGWR